MHNRQTPFPEIALPRSASPHRVVMLAYPGCEMLDAVGPLDIFAATAVTEDGQISSRPAYTVEIVATSAGPVRTSSGLQIVANRSYCDLRWQDVDTLMVAGGPGADALLDDRKLLAWLARAPKRVQRIASICTGAFLLAAAGVLNGRRATTHWYAVDALARRFPGIRVEPDAIFIKDGSVYTSAGVTAGMDLALALVEEDHGRELALALARGFVLFLKRPGGQSQFSAQLAMQASESDVIRELQAWILDHLESALRVEDLAARAAMSPRNFARVFKAQTQTTPAAFIELVRIQSARRYLEQTELSLKEIARICGFQNPDRMRRAFLRRVRVNPQEYRARFQNREALHSQRAAAGAV